MTSIDAARFTTHYQHLEGRAYGGLSPASVERLFEELFDPDDWSPEVRSRLAAARHASQTATTTLTTDPLLGRITVYPGDVHVAGDFTFNNHVLVLGDLEVGSVITAAPEHAILMVLGDVRCRATNLLRAYLFVGGALTATECFFGSVDGFARIGRSLTTRLVLQEHWSNQTLDERPLTVAATHTVDVRRADSLEAMRALLTEQALASCTTAEGRFDPYALLAELALHKPVFSSAG